jgi:uncharacterized protein
MTGSGEWPVTFCSEGEQVVGMWHAPSVAGAQPFPAVVFLHGFTADKTEAQRNFVYTARALAATGIASLRFDFRGSGDSAGDFSDMTVAREVADARAALSFAREQAGVDRHRLGVLGMSFGGLIAVLTLAEEPAVRTAILWNPVSDLIRLVEQRRTPATAAQLATLGAVDYNGWPVGRAFLEALPTIRPIEAAARYAQPMMLLLGEADTVIANEEGRAYAHAREAHGLPVVVQSISAADHGFASIHTRNQAVAHTVNWFRNELTS